MDEVDVDVMYDGETRQFLQQAIGKHQLLFREQSPAGPNPSPESKEVIVEGGKIAYATFGLKSPIDESGKTPVGIVVFQSVHELEGEAFIDDFRSANFRKMAH